MANDPKQYQEEEYLFSEENNTPAEGMDSMESSARPMGDTGVGSSKEAFLKSWRRNIVIGVALLIVVVVVYKVIGSLFAPKPIQQIPSIATSAQMQASPAGGPIANSSENLVPTSSVPTPSPLHASVNMYNRNRVDGQELSKVANMAQGLRTEVDNLNTVTQNLQSSMDSINTQLSQLNTTIAVLADKIEAQENRWVQSQKKAIPKVVAAKPIIRRDVYSVQAIIPGRAWLISSKGSTITVGIGSSIPGYGKVVAIDPSGGQVVMGTGSVIKYSPNDE